QRSSKLFALADCMAQAPDLQQMLGVFWDALSSIVDNRTPGPLWRLQQRPALHHGTGGLHFVASTEYQPQAKLGGFLSCQCVVFAEDFDSTGRQCNGAWPIFANVAFFDNLYWSLVTAEYRVGYALLTMDSAFNLTYGLPQDHRNFALIQGGWQHRPFYVGRGA